MSSPKPTLPPVITAQWLSSHLNDADLVVLDTSWYLPTSGRNPEAEYRRGHLPGAIRFDIDQVSDHSTSLPHMLPSAAEFAAVLENLGIGAGDTVVCYDGSGVNLSSARVWWMFRVFGHQRVAILDGGFQAWARETRPIQTGVTQRKSTGYPVPTLAESEVANQALVASVVAGEHQGQIVDVRSAGRFEGLEDEPRPGLRRGHIPGSINLPFGLLTDPATGLMLPPAALRELLQGRGIDPMQRTVATCGSGVSSCVLALAIEVLRADDPTSVGPAVSVYDGSWAEWGRTTVDS